MKIEHDENNDKLNYLPAGDLTDPPKSEPIPIGEHRDEIATDSPPEEPPGYLVLSHGFRALPYILFADSKLSPSWGTLVFIKGIPPACLINFTINPSYEGIFVSLLIHPTVDGSPRKMNIEMIKIN